MPHINAGMKPGVPQGSILGPVIFCFFFMVLLGQIIHQYNMSFCCYADDLQLYGPLNIGNHCSTMSMLKEQHFGYENRMFWKSPWSVLFLLSST